MLKHAVALLYLVSVAWCEVPVAETPLGRYKGTQVVTHGGRQVLAYRGIRYARPQVRFQEAEMVESHSGVYDATKDGDDCLQISHNYNQYPLDESLGKKVVGSEDCLFLNVYTPDLNPDKKYPVMVWIHGGAFFIGTAASNWHGPELLLDRDVILVTINYRLGIFGFLSYDSDVLPGNLGLKDQALALKWIQENIGGFGGDPSAVTLFGESAGGASVHLQMHSPRSKDLFARAISQSGSLDCPWAITSQSKARNIAARVASVLTCDTATPTTLLVCLRDKTSNEIMDAVLSLKRFKFGLEILFTPVLENKESGFLRSRDLEDRSTVPWMAGVNSGEGLIFYLELALAGMQDLKDFSENYKSIMPYLFNYETHPDKEAITKTIKQNYLGDKKFNEKTLPQFINMISDGLFTRSQVESVRRHEGESYLYLLSYQGKRSFAALIPPTGQDLGVCHGDDLFYMFPMTKAYPSLEFNKEDAKMKELILDLWTNFAIHGKPSSKSSKGDWYESENGKLYVNLSSKGLELSKHLYSTRIHFWDSLPTNLYQFHPTKDEL